MLGVDALCALLFIVPPSGNWRPPELEVSPPPPVESFDDLRRVALQYLGRPYVWGGVGTPGMDCSGFTCRVFAESGYAIPRVSRDQARTGTPVSLDRIAPGDLLFFAERGQPVSHVGIYLGSRQMVHASSGQGEVIIDSVDRRWFRDRLVGARRVLSSTLTAGADDLLTITELSEHDGEFRLSPLVRKRAAVEVDGLQPELLGGGRSFLGVRSGVLTQDGQAAAVVAPEVGLAWPKHGVSLQLGLPIRFDSDGADIGTVDDFGEALRFLREARAGLTGADVELGLQRERAYTLGAGRSVLAHAPMFATRTVPGLGTTDSALTAYGRARIGIVDTQLLVDDVVEPGVVGGSGGLRFDSGLGARVEGAVDLRTADEADLGAVYGEAFFHSSPDRTAQVLANLGGGATLFGDRRSGLIDAQTDFRFLLGRRRQDAIGFGARIGYAFDGGLWEPFGPTYPAGRQATAEAYGEGGERGLVGGRALLRIQSFEFTARYDQALAGAPGPLDRTLALSLDLGEIPLSGTRTLSLRTGYAVRAPLDDDWRVNIFYLRSSIRLFRWLAFEAFALRGPGWDGGAMLRIDWGF